MIFNIIGLIIGTMILGAGVYYFIKEKSDQESRRIYLATSGIGVVLLLGMLLKIVIWG